jgi:CBS domain-containing protein
LILPAISVVIYYIIEKTCSGELIMKKSIYSIKKIVQNDIEYLLIALSENKDSDTFSKKIRADRNIDRIFEISFCEEYMSWQELNPEERMPWSQSLISELSVQMARFKNYNASIAHLKINDIMTKETISFDQDDSIELIAEKIMVVKISGGPVVNEIGVVIGIISEKDILSDLLDLSNGDGIQSLDISSLNRTAKSSMTKNPICAHIDDGIHASLNTMKSNGLRRLPVVDGDNILVGIISQGDIHRAIFKSVIK